MCAGDCDKFDSPVMKACTKACREMVKAMGGHEHIH